MNIINRIKNNPELRTSLHPIDDSTVNNTSKTPIAIIGLGCRLPGNINSPDEFWQLLIQGRHAIGLLPAKRRYDKGPVPHPDFKAIEYGGFLENVDLFDAAFFGISPREARSMDPQQRLLLETTYKAFEHAMIRPDSWAGSETGVFIGVFGHDYERLMVAQSDATDTLHFSTGNTISMMAGRIAHHYDFQGPAITMDTACSSSMVALHLACQSLRKGECTQALVGGVNLLLSSEVSRGFAREGMLSPDARCKTFDNEANGYVRAEGCAVVLLKPFSQVTGSDNVQALIRGSAMNQDGHSMSLTAPSQSAQEAVLRTALEDASIQPADISYIETHGTGTPMGDPIELKAIAQIYRRNRKDTLHIGSVKTNIGHAEGAAGMVGLIKTVLSLQNRYIPAHLHLDQINSQVKLSRIPACIPTKGLPWPSSSEQTPLRAGVSSFGFSGTNVHVILEQAPDLTYSTEKPRSETFSHETPPGYLLTISAANETALTKLAQQYLMKITASESDIDYRRFCVTSNVCRNSLVERLVVTAAQASELSEALLAFTQQRHHPALDRGSYHGEAAAKLAFLFAGDTDATHLTEGIRALILQNPDLKDIFSTVTDLATKKCGLTELWPALYSYQVGLARQYLAWGVTPDVIIGDGVGEYAAACLCGVFNLEEGLELVRSHAELLEKQRREQNWCTVAVYVDEVTMRSRLIKWSGKLLLGSVKNEQCLVIAGPRQLMEQACDEFESLGIEYNDLSDPTAGPLVLMDQYLEKFKQNCAKISFKTPTYTMLSCTSTQFVYQELTQVDYWVHHARSTIRFNEGIKQLQRNHVNLYLPLGELAPDLIHEQWPEQLICQPQPPGALAWLKSMASLYLKGGTINWPCFFNCEIDPELELPTYPFQGKPYWFKRVPDAPSIPRDKISALFYQQTWQASPIDSEPVSAQDLNVSPRVLSDELHGKLKALETGQRQFSTLSPYLEALAVYYIGHALSTLGIDFTTGQRFDTEQVAKAHGVIPQKYELLTYYFDNLAKYGYLEQQGGQWQVLQAPPALAPKKPECIAKITIETTLLQRCAEGLTDILRGATDPFALLFPEEGRLGLTHLYLDSLSFEPMNQILAQTIGQLIKQLPKNRKIRILEIGAGTGGTTARVLKQLPKDRCEYVFTDISPAFYPAAKEKFAEYSFIRFRNLDIETSPQKQGFDEDCFDLVIAANVLHATTNISQTLQHVRSLLVPGGAMVLLEGVALRAWIQMIFGLFEGWRKYTDLHHRSFGPLLAPSVWQLMLTDNGFGESEILLPPGDLQQWLFPQAVIVSCKCKSQALAQPHSIILSDRLGYGSELAKHLDQTKDHFQVLYQDETNITRLRQIITEAIGNIEDRTSLKKPITIIHLWSLEQSDSESSMATAKKGCGSALNLIQILLEADGATEQVRVHFITRGIYGSLVWGLGLMLTQEHPELQHQVIDIDEHSPQAACPLILAELSAPVKEQDNHILLSGQGRLVPRICPLEKMGYQPVLISAERSYLVTGGFGGIGQEVIRWLARQGARNIAVVSQNSDGQRTQAARQQLEQEGISLKVYCSDISVKAEVTELFNSLSNDLPPLIGIFHAAGVFEDQHLAQLEWQVLERVLAPKVTGSWLLHQASLKLDLALDCFVLFSSIFSLVGDNGLSTYVLANKFLDTLATHRQRSGLPATCIHWGPWGKIGMAAAVGERREQQWLQRGITPLSRQTAIYCLEQVLQSGVTHPAVVDADWNKFRLSLPNRQAYFSKIRSPASVMEATTKPNETVSTDKLGEEVKVVPSSTTESDLVNTIRRLPPNRGKEEINQVLIRLVREALGYDQNEPINTELGFNAMGLDSLASQELRNRLQATFKLALSATLLFKYTNFKDLTEYLSTQIHASPDIQSESSPESSGLSPIITDDTDIDASVERELDALNSLLQ